MRQAVASQTDAFSVFVGAISAAMDPAAVTLTPVRASKSRLLSELQLFDFLELST